MYKYVNFLKNDNYVSTQDTPNSLVGSRKKRKCLDIETRWSKLERNCMYKKKY